MNRLGNYTRTERDPGGSITTTLSNLGREDEKNSLDALKEYGLDKPHKKETIEVRKQQEEAQRLHGLPVLSEGTPKLVHSAFRSLPTSKCSRTCGPVLAA